MDLKKPTMVLLICFLLIIETVVAFENQNEVDFLNTDDLMLSHEDVENLMNMSSVESMSSVPFSEQNTNTLNSIDGTNSDTPTIITSGIQEIHTLIPTTLYCVNCTDCSAKIQNANAGDIIKLNANLTGIDTTCV
ncbi:MAG: hypothetical protein KAQ92_04130, partial [Candidatus Aenigmarchaeota archaeon]|nr:hypothetical protein [Candidatus Aenigmarchaeota archaeon]